MKSLKQPLIWIVAQPNNDTENFKSEPHNAENLHSLNKFSTKKHLIQSAMIQYFVNINILLILTSFREHKKIHQIIKDK